MKKITFIVFFLGMCTLVISQNDEELIRKVIIGETAAIQKCDLDAWANHWWHEDYCYFSVTWPNKHWGFYGWDEINTWAKDCSSNNWENKKYDFKFVVSDNIAFVTFLENQGNESTRVLEKRNGEWKLIRMGVIVTSSFEVIEKMDKLKAFEGNWIAQPSSIKITPEWEGTEILHFATNIEMTPAGLRAIHNRKWKNSGNEWEYTREMEIATATNREEFGLFVTGYASDGYTHTEVGKAELTEDGTVVMMPNKHGTDKLEEKAWWTLKDNRNMHLKVEVYGDDGEVRFLIETDLVRQ